MHDDGALAPAVRWREEPELTSAVDCFGAAVGVELGVDVAQVRSDRVRRDEQLGGDFRRAEVAGQVSDDAQLCLAELVDEGRWLATGLGRRRRRGRRGSLRGAWGGLCAAERWRSSRPRTGAIVNGRISPSGSASSSARSSDASAARASSSCSRAAASNSRA